MIQRPFKIAVLATVVEYGGAEKAILSLLEHIDRASFELTPIIFTRQDETGNAFITKLGKINKDFYKILLNRSRIKYLNPLLNLIETLRFLKGNRFDLLHTHGYRANAIGMILSKLAGLPFISTCHGYIPNDKKLIFYNTLDRLVLRHAKKVIAVSEDIKTNLAKSGIPKNCIKVVVNAIHSESDDDADRIRNREERRRELAIDYENFVVGYVGRLSREKGLKDLLVAMRMIKESNARVKLVLIGEGPQKKELEDSVKEWGLGQIVVFIGFQKDIETWIPMLDLFVLPSHTEGTPMALLEAMGLAVPCVASAVGGVPDIIHSGKNGILVSPCNPEAIKDAILHLYKNEALRNEFSRAARETIKLRYNITDSTRKLESEYRRILQR